MMSEIPSHGADAITHRVDFLQAASRLLAMARIAAPPSQNDSEYARCSLLAIDQERSWLHAHGASFPALDVAHRALCIIRAGFRPPQAQCAQAIVALCAHERFLQSMLDQGGPA